jgi:potassium-transporting ATPase potassium-binding subunit
MLMAVTQIVVFGALVVALTKPMGLYLDAVFEGRPTWLSIVLKPVEALVYRASGVDPEVETRWTYYTVALIVFNLCGIVLLFLIVRLQDFLPFNPQHAPGMPTALALNTAVSFVTNTNWQAYAGETAVSTFSQAAGLVVQQFLSAATGIAVGLALIRGFSRKSEPKIGNFWVDITRAWLYVLLPFALVLAVVYAAQGVVQTWGAPIVVHTVEGARQLIATGPVASLEAIKDLGTNGGGFFNANSAHPFENPTPLTNLIQMLSVFLIPAGLTYVFGKRVGDTRQGWAILGAMFLLFVVGVGLVYGFEQAGNPIQARMGVQTAATATQPGGNMEGKETRFGIAQSSIFGVVTTDASNGAVDSQHDSYTPLGGGVLLLNIMLGELIFGGVGVGLAAMLVYALIAVFIAGLMVGRTPEYVGKKLESKEVRMATLVILIMAFSMLALFAIAVVTPAGLAGRLNLGPHGFSEIVYAFTSGTGNNGSAFAGLTANSVFYNLLVALAMFVGRFFFIIPVMAIAGSLAAKKRVPASAGTFPTNGGLFVGLLVGVVLIVGALTFFPALALGPIVEQLLMNAGKLF